MRGQAVTKKDRGGRVIFTIVRFVGRFRRGKSESEETRRSAKEGSENIKYKI